MKYSAKLYNAFDYEGNRYSHYIKGIEEFYFRGYNLISFQIYRDAYENYLNKIERNQNEKLRNNNRRNLQNYSNDGIAETGCKDSDL